VRCIHCHVGEDPNNLDHVDFVSDERETKRVARAMMRMVQEINGKLLPASGQYYGRDAYDFGPPTLDALAEKLGHRPQQVPAAIALARLNLEFHPDSHYTHFVLGSLLRTSGDTAGAAASLRRALELSPGNAWYERALKQIEPPKGQDQR